MGKKIRKNNQTHTSRKQTIKKKITQIYKLNNKGTSEETNKQTNKWKNELTEKFTNKQTINKLNKKNIPTNKQQLQKY